MNKNHPIARWLMLLALSTFNLQPSTAHAQSTAFTYQGRLNDSGGPATGIYDLRFTIYDAVTNGNLIAGPLTNSATGVTNGLFTTTVDFGPYVFFGESYWLDIAVRTDGSGMFTELTPRQPILPVPYALYATNAGYADIAGNGPIAQYNYDYNTADLVNGSWVNFIASGVQGATIAGGGVSESRAGTTADHSAATAANQRA